MDAEDTIDAAELLSTIKANKPSTGFARSSAYALALIGFVLVSVDPALAQDTGTAFCETALVGTIRNLFTVIQFGGPLVGGVLALGATVAMPAVRRSDLKREMKEVRNQGLLWGVIVAPLGATILQFILGNIVVGGASCGF